MLNENDFNEIGKRMYDLEADPPGEGWNKIAGGLKNQPGKRGFFSRNWWKPLILVIPLSIWIAVENDVFQTGDLSGNLKHETLASQKPAPNGRETTAGKTEAADVVSTEDLPSTQKTLASEVADQAKNPQRKKSAYSIRAEASDADPLVTVEITENESSATQERSQIADAAPSRHPTNNSGASANVDDKESVAPTPAKETVLNQNSNSDVGGLGDMAIAKSNIKGDSLHQENENSASGSIQTEVVSEEEKKRESMGRWRVTAAFAPNYLIKSVKPVVNDEVLITKMENRKTFESLGFSAAFGIGKEIRENLFIDAAATFLSQKEMFAYSYTTGKVDTLIARQNEDGSVRVIPVYASTSAEISSKLNYGGIRLGGTYYFWNRGKTRFNISAAGGANFLLFSNVKENISGEWVSAGSDRAAKSLYTLTIGAGYNVRLGDAWEFQINPSLTYYSGKGNSYQQILNLNQRSYGVMFMVSKFF